MGKFYNLPPSWNPGYADPENVLDEGLRRRAFVTAQAPRGTYDDPKVGYGGYAVPNYIGKEGYGQGSFVTKWAPRGSYGPRIPNYLDQRFTKVVSEAPAPGGGTAIRMDVLSGIDGRAGASSGMFGQFGARAAATIIAKVMRLPASQRRAAIKQALDAMDPSLFSLAERYSKSLIASGMDPRSALASGLARAISEGMLRELERTGRTRTAPQPNTLPGLGCYRARGALGALPGGGAAYSVASSATFNAPTTCAPQPGFTWDQGGFWRRLKVGEIAQPAPMVNGVCGGVATGGTAGGVSTGGGPTSSKMMQIGPFTVPISDRGARFKPSDISAAAYDDLMKQIAKGSERLTQMNFGFTPKKASDYGLKYGYARVARTGGVGVGGAMLANSDNGYVSDQIINGNVPVYYFKHPESGKRYGVTAKFTGTKEAPEWLIGWKENEPDPITRGFSWLIELVAKIIDVIGDVVDAIGDLACGLVNNPGAAGAAQTAGGPAAGVGVAIAGSACKSGGQPPPAPQQPVSNAGMLLVAGAGALLIVAAIARKKRK